ncbi:hypothetical protein [Nocardia carnea]|nr:hypothetical protein [Nocardia carnea]
MPNELATLRRIAGKLRREPDRITRVRSEFAATIEALWRAPVEEVRRAW